MKVFRPIVGVVTAIVLTPLGFGLIWFGNGELSANRIAGVLLTLVGVALLLMVIQTGHVSSFGLILAGVVVSIVGAIALLSPPFAQSVTAWLKTISSQIGTPADRWMIFGFVLALGIVIFGSAVVTWFAHRPTERSTSPGLRGFVSVVLALVGSVAGFGFLTRTDQHLVILGAVILGATLVTGMVSSVGLFVSGFVVFVVGILAFAIHPFALALAQSPLIGGNGMEAGAQAALQLGFVAAVGAILLATAVVARAAHARAVRRVS